jgi:hypothetical protein
MLSSTAQHSTAQHSTAQHSTAQHSTAQHSTAQHSTHMHTRWVFTCPMQSWTGEATVGDGLVSTFRRLPHIEWMMSTLGRRGSVLLERPISSSSIESEGGDGVVADEVLGRLFAEASGDAGSSSPVVCTSANGTGVGAGGMASTEGPVRLRLGRGPGEGPAVAVAAAAARRQEAALNADPAGAARYGADSRGAAEEEEGPDSECVRVNVGLYALGFLLSTKLLLSVDLPVFKPAPTHSAPVPLWLLASGWPLTGGVVARVTVSQAARLPQESVQDTTGAGDAFIGSVIYGLATGKGLRETMRLAAVVAACKCTALGARPGLPRRESMHSSLL